MNETTQKTQEGDQPEFHRWEQMNLTVVVLGFIILATPVLFILADIGLGAPVVRLGIVITLVWLTLITASFIFSRLAKKRGYLSR